MQGSRDAVSRMGLEERMMVARGLVESEGYEAIRGRLSNWGVAEEAMPSDDSFRAYRETEEYKVYHGLRLQGEGVALEAGLAEELVAQQRLVLQARIQAVMLARLEAGTLDDVTCMRVWEGLQRSEWRELGEDRAQLARRRQDHAEKHHGDGLLVRAADEVGRALRAQELGAEAELVGTSWEIGRELLDRARFENERECRRWIEVGRRSALAERAACGGSAGESAADGEGESGDVGEGESGDVGVGGS